MMFPKFRRVESPTKKFGKFRKLVDHDNNPSCSRKSVRKSVRGYFTREEQEALRNLKRHCENHACHASMVLDLEGFTCPTCLTYHINREYLNRAIMDMREFKNKHDVWQYIRETCNSPKCYSASNKDLNAFTCIVCAELRDDKMDEIKAALEKVEDMATINILSGKIGAKMSRLLRIGSSKTSCNCNYNIGFFVKDCKCGKSTPKYAKARQQYIRTRDANMEAASVLAYIRSICTKQECIEGSKAKITRFVDPKFSNGPACNRCEFFYGNGDPKNQQYIDSKQNWENDVVQYKEVAKYMKGTCRIEFCFFSAKNTDSLDEDEAEYCTDCYDALHYNLDGLKRDMLEARERQETSFTSDRMSGLTVGRTVVAEESEGEIVRRFGTPGSSPEREAAYRQQALERLERERSDEEEIDAMLAGDPSLRRTTCSPLDEDDF